jgi:hypothetical protein
MHQRQGGSQPGDRCRIRADSIRTGSQAEGQQYNQNKKLNSLHEISPLNDCFLRKKTSVLLF